MEKINQQSFYTEYKNNNYNFPEYDCIYDYDQIQNDLIIELNNLRQDPKSFVQYIKNQMNVIKKNRIIKDNKMIINLEEGRKAYEEAISFLMQQNPVEPLEPDENLCQASIDLIEDIGPKGIVGHEDNKGGYVSDRIEKYCEWDYFANEIFEMSSSNPIDILIDLIVDDGLPERLNRKALFNPNYHFVGVGCGPHNDYGIYTVLIFVGDLRPKGSASKIYQLKRTNQNIKSRKNNPYQVDDPDAPDDTIGLRLVKKSKLMGGKMVLITKKFYKLADGTEHVVEVQEDLN